jgi:hypothetical protein
MMAASDLQGAAVHDIQRFGFAAAIRAGLPMGKKALDDPAASPFSIRLNNGRPFHG